MPVGPAGVAPGMQRPDAASRVRRHECGVRERNPAEWHAPCASQAEMPTLTARWVHRPREIAGEHGETLATRSHEVIREWAEARRAVPVSITADDLSRRSGLLWIRAGVDEKRLARIAWDEWFDAFESDNLVFVFRSTRTSGRRSNFFRLDPAGGAR